MILNLCMLSFTMFLYLLLIIYLTDYYPELCRRLYLFSELNPIPIRMARIVSGGQKGLLSIPRGSRPVAEIG